MWALAHGGDMIVDIFTDSPGGFDEKLRVTRLGRESAGNGDGKKRKAAEVDITDDASSAGRGNMTEDDSGGGGCTSTVANRLASPDAALVPTGHEYAVTAVAFAGDDSMYATGDSFGHVVVHVAG